MYTSGSDSQRKGIVGTRSRSFDGYFEGRENVRAKGSV